MAVFLHVLLLVAGAAQMQAQSDVLLKPVLTDKPPAALLLVPGYEFSPSQYTPLAKAIQEHSQLSLWVGIPGFHMNTVTNTNIGPAINRIMSSMHGQGLDQKSPVVLAVHSPLSAIQLQNYLLQNNTASARTVGMVLLGSFLQRDKRSGFPVHSLTIGGELDGVCRLTRIMEEYYHRVQVGGDFNVVVVRGMSHAQFASGDPPQTVKDGDLRPEISSSTAHDIIAALVSNFTSIVLGDSAKIPYLKKAVMETGAFLNPIIKAYELEANYKLKVPCFENPPSPSCQVGCPWTQLAMVTMAELGVGHVNDSDSIHPASEIFPKIHHPSILTNCSTVSPQCVVSLSSVSENVYDKEVIDDASAANSAYEIRAKLKSRQTVMMAAGYGEVDFNVSDAGSRCKTINQQAYDWALHNADPATVKRFMQFGVQLVMGEDKGCLENGGLWIYLPMDYTTATNSTGGEVVVLQSIQLKTKTNYPIKMFDGMHYCKLLSPARAMEWVYVDGLRKYYSLKNN